MTIAKGWSDRVALLDPAIFASPTDDSFDRSVWQQTAIEMPHFPRVAPGATADVAIVGAGYTGLSTALHLAERGVSVVVLEARQPGFGASGRSGGQVVPMFKCEPDEIRARYGDQVGAELLRLVAGSADDVFALVRRFHLECDAWRTGWIQGAWGRNGAEILRRRHAQWAELRAPVRMLTADEMRTLTGTSLYQEGWIHEAGGSVNPLGYVRALAGAARAAGARIFADSPVIRLARAGERWIAGCESGDVTAKTIVLATNAYTTALWPGLRESVVPLYSMQAASTPLPSELRASILPFRHCVADTRRLVWYFRVDRDGRFVLGSRGPFKARPSGSDARVLVRAARSLYPALAGVQFPFVWSGRVAMTNDQMPHLHRLAPGVIAAVGYNGRGVAMATTMGWIVAAACLAEVENRPSFPTTELRRVPFHAFHRAGVRALVTYFRLRDRLA